MLCSARGESGRDSSPTTNEHPALSDSLAKTPDAGQRRGGPRAARPGGAGQAASHAAAATPS